MNATRLATALAGALLAGTSYAFDATQFVDPPSAPTVGAAAAERAAAPVRPIVMSYGDATQFVDTPLAAPPSREAVRREASMAPGHQGMDDCPYVGG